MDIRIRMGCLGVGAEEDGSGDIRELYVCTAPVLYIWVDGKILIFDIVLVCGFLFCMRMLTGDVYRSLRCRFV